MLSDSVWFLVGFNVVVVGLLVLDLGVFHRKSHAVSTKEAAIWSAVWISLALLFNLGLFLFDGTEKGLEFTAGYLIEKSLSVDNIFIFLVIFSTFKVPAAYQHRVLFYGILGALVMRGGMIAGGSALLHHFHWVIYLFGGLLLVTGIRMALQRHVEPHPERNPLLRLARRMLPVTEDFEKDKFFVRRAGKLMVTPLFLVLLVVEATDVVFAIDSIPAIFAVTNDSFIVYTSNVFAILGLRSLYFLLSGVMDKFYYLKLALSVVLVFVGVKMVLTDVYKIPIVLSLAIIVSILAVAVLASWSRARRLALTHNEHASAPPPHPLP